MVDVEGAGLEIREIAHLVAFNDEAYLRLRTGSKELDARITENEGGRTQRAAEGATENAGVCDTGGFKLGNAISLSPAVAAVGAAPNASPLENQPL